MFSLTKAIALIWILTGLLALVIGVKYMNKPENRKAIQEQLKEMAEELKIKEEDCLCIMYVGFVVFGFVGASVALIRRLKGYLRKGE
jgi:nitrate/nitrite transporter NarK